MQLRVFTLRLDPETGAFDDSAMQSFLADRTVVSASEHFFIDAGHPTLAILVNYRDEHGLQRSARSAGVSGDHRGRGHAEPASRGAGSTSIADLRASLAPADAEGAGGLGRWFQVVGRFESRNPVLARAGVQGDVGPVFVRAGLQTAVRPVTLWGGVLTVGHAVSLADGWGWSWRWTPRSGRRRRRPCRSR